MSTKQNLAIIGGRLETDNDAVFQKMKAISGGRIAIFSTASRVPEEVGGESVEQFMQHGFDAHWIPLFLGNHRETAFSQDIVATLDDYGHVFFTGGDQARIIEALIQDGRETPVLQKLRALHRAGGLIAGSSAGAAMMSKQSIMGGVSLEAIVYGVTEDPKEMGMLLGQGLGFFQGGLVDQHFLERGRFGRLIVGMFATQEPFGFGVDENTAMFVQDDEIHVLGESGVVVLDARDAFSSDYGELGRDYCSVRMHFVDNGDTYSLSKQRLIPGRDKTLVAPSSISYTSPGHVNRSVFGANILLELITRLAEGTESYRLEKGTAFDPDAELEVTLHLRRPKRSCSYSALYEDSREYSVSGFDLDLTCEAMSLETRRLRQRERARYNAKKLIHGSGAVPTSRLIATGSGLLNDKSTSLIEYIREHALYPVSIVAAASSEPREATRDYMELFERHGIEAKNLNIRESNTLHQSQNEQLLQEIVDSPAILFLGGAQERLVDTLLYRGENTRVLHAIIRAYHRGAAVIAVSGSSSSLSEAMIAGGSTVEALRYGVSADSWLQGVIVEPGFGFIRDAIIDQNVLSRDRLGRLLVACVEEEERFGFGLLDHSGVSFEGDIEAAEAIGAHGFILLDLHNARSESSREHFKVTDVDVFWIQPGERIVLPSGEIQRESLVPYTGTMKLEHILQTFEENALHVNTQCGKESCKIEVQMLHESNKHARIRVKVARNTDVRRPIKDLDALS